MLMNKMLSMVKEEIRLQEEELDYLERGWERVKGNLIARQLEQRPIELKRIKLQARLSILKKVLNGDIPIEEVNPIEESR